MSDKPKFPSIAQSQLKVAFADGMGCGFLDGAPRIPIPSLNQIQDINQFLYEFAEQWLNGHVKGMKQRFLHIPPESLLAKAKTLKAQIKDAEIWRESFLAGAKLVLHNNLRELRKIATRSSDPLCKSAIEESIKWMRNCELIQKPEVE